MKNDDFYMELTASPLFAGLTTEEVKAALDCLGSDQRHYDKGSFILRQGEAVAALGLVRSGTVHILREDFWGNRDLIAVVVPGQLFGEAYACTGVPSGVSVMAETGTEILFLETGRLLFSCSRACSFHARLIRNLLQVTAEKNLLLNEKLSHVTQRTTQEKLLSFLSAQSLRQGSATFSIPFDRQQLADYLAVNRSALSSELGKLQKEGLLEFRKNRFTLHRPPEQ